ncbi:hypothetical protein [Saccharolobus islandicus]|uniref:hypothetical protein n=1 Tax=Saccharolobus islandicus TaxID=43080 RepID=UPI00163CFFC2|nr:hypothetical protein [Sulfolobus islandicus]
MINQVLDKQTLYKLVVEHKIYHFHNLKIIRKLYRNQSYRYYVFYLKLPKNSYIFKWLKHQKIKYKMKKFYIYIPDFDQIFEASFIKTGTKFKLILFRVNIKKLDESEEVYKQLSTLKQVSGFIFTSDLDKDKTVSLCREFLEYEKVRKK